MPITTYEADVAEAMQDYRLLMSRFNLLRERWNPGIYENQYNPTVTAGGVFDQSSMNNAQAAMVEALNLYTGGKVAVTDGTEALKGNVNVAAEFTPEPQA